MTHPKTCIEGDCSEIGYPPNEVCEKHQHRYNHMVSASCVEQPCFDAHGCEVRGHCQTYELLKDLGIYN